MNDYEELEPREVFKWFSEISMIPRCSGDEKRVSDFLVNFAQERQLEYYQDDELNVIIKKPATSGYENSPTVIIQGHMDMVCEKTKTSDHDFEKDPILWKRDGDLLYARDTTLGGDDGIAVAYALSILDSEDIVHPNLEVIITTNEETGMDGANGLDGKMIDGDILLNIDAEVEGVFLASCSGGANSFVKFEKEYEDFTGETFKIVVDGLFGGHSGMEIDKQRGNSIKIMGRILNHLDRKLDFRLVSLTGGSKHNAIAKHSEAILALDMEDCNLVEELLDEIKKEIQLEYRISDPDIRIEISRGGKVDRSYTEDLTRKLIDFSMLILYGVRDMSLDIEGLVQTSSNVGVILEDESSMTFMSCVRSNVGSLLHQQLREIEILARLIGAKVWVEKEYPAWEFVSQSDIRDLAVETYKDLFGKEPEISAAHCGLETGIINAIKPGLDMLSFGPDLYDVHTTNEHLSIKSVEKTWEFTKLLLKNIK